jgi:predicted dinucleotide-binding enzyme
MESVVVVIGAGQIGQAIARRVGVGKHVVLATAAYWCGDVAEVRGHSERRE